MNELQSKLLEILIWFHKFCENNHLTYYLAFGTMLGAVRHKGFIPWDDDIDVYMPRDDYERYLDLTFNKKGKYVTESYRNGNKDYVYSWTKVYDSETTLEEKLQKYKLVRGLYIDVFPLDGCGNSFKKAEKIIKKCDFIKRYKIVKFFTYKKERKFYKNCGVFLINILPPYKGNFLKINKRINEKYSRIKYNESIYVFDSAEPKKTRKIINKEVFGTPKLYEFEGHLFFGPEKSEEYLTITFGDYRKLPPIEEQVSHHTFSYYDLNKSYLKK